MRNLRIAIFKTLFIVTGAVCSVATATGAPPPAGLDFGLRYREEEKLFGAPISTKDPLAPDVREIATYVSPRLEHGLIRVLRDRDLDVVRFEFVYSRWENGGNDPRTGKPWAMPPAFVNAALKLCNAEWKQTGKNELVAKNGRMRAVVGEGVVTVCAP